MENGILSPMIDKGAQAETNSQVEKGTQVDSLISAKKVLQEQEEIFSIETLHIEKIQQELDKGSITSEILVKVFKERIKQVQCVTKSIAQYNHTANNTAILRDMERRRGEVRGPLHGIPILINENFATLDGMETTAGSFALRGARPPREATMVQKLRDAGAIILGKTNVSEFGYARSGCMPHGWSPMYGQCQATFYGSQDPQSSSSGSAVAMSQGLAAATIGVDTIGGIIYAADRCNVVGLRPTVGLTSRAGIIPVNKYQDTIGPITKNVKDAALILQVIAGQDPLDPKTAETPFQNRIPFLLTPDYVRSCRHDAFENTKIAIPRSTIAAANEYGKRLEPELLASFENALKIITSLGGTLIENAEFPKWKAGETPRSVIWDGACLREGLESYFGSLAKNPHNIETMSDLTKFLKETPEEQYDRYGADWFDQASNAAHLPDDKAREIKAHVDDLGEEVNRMLDQYACDAIVAPAYTDIPFDLGGNPAIVVPLGFYSHAVDARKVFDRLKFRGPNIPYGLMFVGRHFNEAKLLGLAYAFEQATNIAQMGKQCIRPTVDLPPPQMSTNLP
ncbi:amidase [Penicillium macrosclerotiorum]|uniref:amidase n=1 Tax=Penicillium macrosclerotiorum TaxID=303699 RepID=UPI0025490FD0|nr:amidase [Penicillium macrosclerotiorum]KAJ5668934.1 amidase [Penicillium macrosclerotiorum]